MSKYPTDKVVTLQGKEYILFEGLLECAHREYDLATIDTNIIQLPNKGNGNEAIFKAIVTTKDGKSFGATGDANPENVNSKIQKHLIRMAETRAVGRALRFLTGFGTVFEELGDLDHAPSAPATPPITKKIETLTTEDAGIEEATKAQLRKIQKDAEALGLTENDLKKKALSYPKLSKTEATAMIKWLKDDQKSKKFESAPF